MNIAIVGCGASALYFSAFNKKDNITIFERHKKIARKLLASGNGRCNILNINADANDYNNPSFMKELFNLVDAKFLYKSLESLGLTLKIDDEGRVYPYSESSQNVLDILLDNSKAKIIMEYEVKTITKINGKYKINDYDKLFDKVILASGSYANIIKDSDSCYNYLKSLGITITDLKPSLVGFKAQGLKKISGIRAKADVSLYSNDKLVHKEFGEVIFKDDGISGIVVMNMSSRYSRLNLSNAYLMLDLIPGFNPSCLKGALNPNLYEYIKDNNINPHQFRIDINGTYDFTQAQVINGGVGVDLLDSFRLKNDKNIFLMGEMIDIDGVCGGYNLTFAFASAEIVRRSIENENSN